MKLQDVDCPLSTTHAAIDPIDHCTVSGQIIIERAIRLRRALHCYFLNYPAQYIILLFNVQLFNLRHFSQIALLLCQFTVCDNKMCYQNVGENFSKFLYRLCYHATITL